MDAASDTTDPRPTALVWLAPDQTDLIASVAAVAGVRVAFAGCDASTGEGVVRQVAQRLGAEPFDDLRHALASAPAELALLAHATSDSAGPLLSDRDALRACRERRLRVLSLAPAPASVVDALTLAHHSGADVPPLLPLLRWSAGFRAATGVFEAFGPARTLALSARCAPFEGSLGARLVDAMDAVHALFGEPDSIDASIIGAVGAGRRRPGGPDSILDLRGDLAGHLRYADGRAVSLSITDRGGRWFRGLTVIGDQGCLRIDESAFEWLGAAGARIDSSGSPDARVDAAHAIGEQVRRLLDAQTPADSPAAKVHVLAMAEAAALSARTGQPESPATLRRMAGAD